LPVAQARTTVHRSASPALHSLAPETLEVTVVGGHAFGADSAELAGRARCLAAACDLSILGVRFVSDSGEWKFASADPCPALGAAGAAALLRVARSRNGGQRWAA